MLPAVMVPHSSLRAPSMTKTSSSPTWRWRANWARGSMRFMSARRWVAGSSHRSFRLTPGWRSSQGRSLTEMMRDIGCMVAMVVSSFGLPLHVLSSNSCRSFSFQMNDAEQLIERQIRRDIQYRLILRLILRQNTVHLFTSRQSADGHPEGSERPWRTSMEHENVTVKCVHDPQPKPKLRVRLSKGGRPGS